MALTPIKIVFFGSFQDFSADVLLGLLNTDHHIEIAAVVTTPPYQDKSGSEIKNPVQLLAQQHGLPILTPSTLDEKSLQDLIRTAGAFEYFVTAGYGKLLPPSWLSQPPQGALNLHFSLLPKYRGANPAEWALLMGETTSGVTLIEMSPEFDTGKIIAQAAVDIAPNDTRETLYQKLYQLGAEVLPQMVITYAAFQNQHATDPDQESDITYFLPPQVQPTSPTPYAKRFKREDAFIEWSVIKNALAGESNTENTEAISKKYQGLLKTAFQESGVDSDAVFISIAVRALAGFPGLWTMIPTSKGEKRMKILQTSVEAPKKLNVELVQIEGQQPATWNQVKNQVLPE